MTSLEEREAVIKACQQIIQMLDSNSAAQDELITTELSSQVVTVDEIDLTFFARSTDVNSSIIDLTEKIQSIIVNLRPHISELTYNYLMDTLYSFHFDGTLVVQPLTLAILPHFKQSLDAFVASVKACIY